MQGENCHLHGWHNFVPIFTAGATGGGPIVHPSVWTLFNLEVNNTQLAGVDIIPVESGINRFTFTFDGPYPAIPPGAPIPPDVTTSMWSTTWEMEKPTSSFRAIYGERLSLGLCSHLKSHEMKM